MKRVRINAGFVGLVMKNDNYKRVITEGLHWLSFGEHVMEYDMTKAFKSVIDLSILLKDVKLFELLMVVELKDNEIALLFENGNFKSVLTPGRYAYWKGIIDYSFTKIDLSQIEIGQNIPVNLIIKPELISYVRVYVVESYEEGLLFLDGKFKRRLEPGVYYFWKNAIAISVLKADLRQLQMEISGQEILTSDKAAIRVNFYTKYKVSDIEKALLENKEFEKQLYVIMQLALREYIGGYSLDELLEKKESIADAILKNINERAQGLGVAILDCGIKDIILPGEVKEIMNQVLVAQKKAQANIISRREETASTRSLLNTAKLLEENTMLFKLKEMEYVEKIADKINTISLTGGNQVIEQLKEIFSPKST